MTRDPLRSVFIGGETSSGK